MSIVDTTGNIQSYLRKLKRSSRFLETKLRWFSLDVATRRFYYTKQQNSVEKYHRINIADITAFIVNPIKTPKSEWMYPFQILTRRGYYTLYAETQSIHNSWCQALNSLFKCQVLTERIKRPIYSENNGDVLEESCLLTSSKSCEKLKRKSIEVKGYIKRRY
jgi:hypothetical protein